MFAAKSGSLDGLKLPHRNFRSTVLQVYRLTSCADPLCSYPRQQIGETLDPHLVRHFEKETLRHDNACEEGCVLSLHSRFMAVAGYGMLYRRRVVDEQELNFPGALVLVLSSEIEVPSDLVAVASLSHGFKVVSCFSSDNVSQLGQVVEVLSRLDVGKPG
eukprot:766691-Hanusia_phi.AAC.10